MSGAVQVSVVIPMYNEAPNVRPLMDRLFPVLEGLGETFEVVVVDDGSFDTTLQLLEQEKEKRPQLRVIPFARNYGQHAAVLAGLECSRGQWVVTMDADLQNPPEEIPKLIEAFRRGHDLVNTYREGRQDPLFRRLASRITNAVIRKCSGIELRDFGCMLRGYHRDIIEPMTHRKEFRTFIPALAMLFAGSPVEIPVAHSAREVGESRYSLLKLLSLQLDLITGFSVAPLRVLMGLGTLLAVLGIAFGAMLIVLRLILGSGWAAEGVFTLFAILFLFVGLQFLAFGLLGEYIGRIYQVVRERPVYVLRKSAETQEMQGNGRQNVG